MTFESKRQRRDKPVQVKLTEAEIGLLDFHCADLGVTRSTLIRRLLDEEINGAHTPSIDADLYALVEKLLGEAEKRICTVRSLIYAAQPRSETPS